MNKFYLMLTVCLCLSLQSGGFLSANPSESYAEVAVEEQQLTPANVEHPFSTLEPVEATTPEADPYRFYTAFLGMLSTLGIIVVMIVGITWFLKKILMTRQNQMNQTSHIKVIETRAITSKTMLHLVEVDGKRVLIADSQHGVTKLLDLESETSHEDSDKS